MEGKMKSYIMIGIEALGLILAIVSAAVWPSSIYYDDMCDNYGDYCKYKDEMDYLKDLCNYCGSTRTSLSFSIISLICFAAAVGLLIFLLFSETLTMIMMHVLKGVNALVFVLMFLSILITPVMFNKVFKDMDADITFFNDDTDGEAKGWFACSFLAMVVSGGAVAANFVL